MKDVREGWKECGRRRMEERRREERRQASFCVCDLFDLFPPFPGLSP